MSELRGSGFLYALSAIATTFASFSTLVLILRQVSGGSRSGYDAWVAISSLQGGFFVTMSALLPPLLFGSGWLDAAGAWRLSSVIVFVAYALLIGTFPTRRRRITGVPTPRFVIVNLALLSLSLPALALNALAWPASPGFGLYAAALLWMFLLAVLAYLQAIALIVRQDQS